MFSYPSNTNAARVKQQQCRGEGVSGAVRAVITIPPTSFQSYSQGSYIQAAGKKKSCNVTGLSHRFNCSSKHLNYAKEPLFNAPHLNGTQVSHGTKSCTCPCPQHPHRLLGQLPCSPWGTQLGIILNSTVKNPHVKYKVSPIEIYLSPIPALPAKASAELQDLQSSVNLRHSTI